MAPAERPRSRTPPRAGRGGEEGEEVGLWQVLPEAGLDVRISCSLDAEVLGHKPRGTVVYGRRAAEGWVVLSDEKGFLPAESSTGPTLKWSSATLSSREAAGEAAEPGEAAEAKEAPDAEEGPAAEEPPKPFRCFGCELGFDTEAELQAHVRASAGCSGDAWQAAVSAMACLPGAGTQLWCPACSDGLGGWWSGSATKAAGLLRHLAAGAKDGQPRSPQHARLWETLLALLLADPPPRAEGEQAGEVAERMQEWAMASRLLEATGPLLARPGPEARKAVRKLQDRTLGPDPLGEGEEEEEADAAGAPAQSEKKAKKAAAAVEGPSYSFYNDDIPMDVFAACQDQTKRTAEGVPVMDLLSSDEETAPAREGLTEL